MNNVLSPKCILSTDILSYLYGEMPAAEYSTFESHLLDCGDCTDEFAAISIARYEVYDWKMTEFEPLETPVFVIPTPVPQLATGLSWVDTLRNAFNHSWAVPGFALAGLAIISTFAGVFNYTGGTEELAQVNSNVTPVVESRSIVENETLTAPPAMAKDSVEEQAPPPGSKPEHAAAVRSVQKVKVRPARRSLAPRAVEASATRTRERVVPRLNEFAEDEDTSLRLAQLFEDVDTSD